MPNNFFSFQKFTVKQEKSAMKVTTEASLFGAWVANELQNKEGRALDIGTGTGLLSLMVAQETGLRIDAIEIEEGAAKQAKENISESPFKERIQVITGDIADYVFVEKYDFIFSNPPFYETDLSSPDVGKQKAHHGEGLKLSSLCKNLGELLKEEGEFFILFPSQRKKSLLKELNGSGLFANRILYVYQNEKEKPFRIFIKGSRNEALLEEEKFFIREGLAYSPAFIKLLTPYYLPQALKQNQKDIRSGE